MAMINAAPRSLFLRLRDIEETPFPGLPGGASIASSTDCGEKEKGALRPFVGTRRTAWFLLLVHNLPPWPERLSDVSVRGPQKISGGS
jgi:hypothetical protein